MPAPILAFEKPTRWKSLKRRFAKLKKRPHLASAGIGMCLTLLVLGAAKSATQHSGRISFLLGVVVTVAALGSYLALNKLHE